MLEIRREQVWGFCGPKIDAFLVRARQHVEQYFPEQVAALAEEELRGVILHGLRQADAYGLSSERDLLRYQTLMFVFGRDFDRDPSFPWAARILGSAEAGSTKTSRLQTEALKHEREGRGCAPLGPPR